MIFIIMSKHVCFVDGIDHVTGQHSVIKKGCKTLGKIRFFKDRGGNVSSVTFGGSVPRDYELHPLTARELAARAAFKQAATAVKAIMNNDEQKVQALQRFNEAKAKRLTTATTLHGFLMQEAI